MRLGVLWLLAVAACSFEHGVDGSTPARPDAPWSGQDPDAAAMPADAPAVVAADAACPDDDADGVCNAVDDWPCGAKPTDAPATMTFTANAGQSSVTITQVNLDATGRYAVATPQENLALTLHYAIDDTACATACIDQLEIGWSPGGRSGCVFDDTVSKTAGAAGTVNVTIRAPATKQAYDLRVNLGQNYSCTYGGANGWWKAAPDATRTIARLCVH